MKNYIKSPIAAAIGLSCTFSTVLKFYILCIRKSMPEMNENVLAKYAIFGIMGIVLSFNGAKYTGTTKPVHNQVSFENGFCLIFSLSKLFVDHLYGLL